MTDEDRYLLQRYLLMTLDPIHPGAGGYRLGRVDNSIAREPGTRLPKIPGTSLHGAARSYAAYLYGTPEAAGQSQDDVENPKQNPVCYTFGYITKDKNGDEQTAFSGVVNIFDARVLLFPVHSAHGPVWVSTVERLQAADGFEREADKKFGIHFIDGAKLANDEEILTSGDLPDKGCLNLGWLMLEVAGQVAISTPKDSKWGNEDQWKAVADRIVLVKETLFGQIVNSNLEVRTSVSINPHTGAAEDGALFTYEALPRATFLTAEVVLDDYSLPIGKRIRPFPVEKTKQGNPLPKGPWNAPPAVVQAGLEMMEYLGVGGMGTRGFGRVALVGEPMETNPLADSAGEAADA